MTLLLVEDGGGVVLSATLTGESWGDFMGEIIDNAGSFLTLAVLTVLVGVVAAANGEESTVAVDAANGEVVEKADSDEPAEVAMAANGDEPIVVVEAEATGVELTVSNEAAESKESKVVPETANEDKPTVSVEAA